MFRTVPSVSAGINQGMETTMSTTRTLSSGYTSRGAHSEVLGETYARFCADRIDRSPSASGFENVGM
jgi:hypothetical protein